MITHLFYHQETVELECAQNSWNSIRDWFSDEDEVIILDIGFTLNNELSLSAGKRPKYFSVEHIRTDIPEEKSYTFGLNTIMPTLRSEWVILWRSDYVYHRNYFSEILNGIKKGNVVIPYEAFVGATYCNGVWCHDNFRLLKEGTDHDFLKFSHVCPTYEVMDFPHFAIKKELWIQLNGMDNRLWGYGWQFPEFFCRLKNSGLAKFSVGFEMYAFHQTHGGSFGLGNLDQVKTYELEQSEVKLQSVFGSPEEVMEFKDAIKQAPLRSRRKDEDYELKQTSSLLSSFANLIPPNPLIFDAGSNLGVVKTDNSAIRLHLGCGEQYLEGYVNIDYPPAMHSVMHPKVDRYADIIKLEYPESFVDEIRLHHVFEHFNRVTALGMLIHWHEWLKVGGKLHIETPDLVGSSRIVLSDASWRVKAATIRHLAGDQAASWAYHIDHWCPERFERTLKLLGFDHIQISTSNWPEDPYLANVTAIAIKSKNMSREQLVQSAEQLLTDSMVSPKEQATFHVWKEQLQAFLVGAPHDDFQLPCLATNAPVTEQISSIPIFEIHGFNQINRDRWVRQMAASIPPGSTVLDVGAGTCPYRSLFQHCTYKSHDFKKYDGEKLGGTTEYGTIDYVSEITNIPVLDDFFDVVLCTEVLEHVPEPISALQEMIRILKPGGRLLLTAPLGSGLHQLPFHYYGGFSPEWYRFCATRFGLNVVEIVPNGGFFKLLAQECVRAGNLLTSCPSLAVENINEMRHLLSDKLPRFFFAVEDTLFIDQFTVGYHVELHKPAGLKSSAVATEAWAPGDRFEKIMRLKQAHFEALIK